ncbi:Sexual differentiation process protein isp4 [Tolypocladium paradoxum]|uniref:Sexual differentiation process protein isp4 n=1 Tax=Tolypocladium paradoxum TaxID=94208 RepID=A0A2S4KUK5_9HYPO|nr:Sexual differentiation process protein isp4 [Tolypocladium paradoxum]
MEKGPQPQQDGGGQAQEGGIFDKKPHYPIEKVHTVASQDVEPDRDHTLGGHLNATEDDILEAKELAASMSLESARILMTKVLAIHNSDPNFPYLTLQTIKEFLSNDDIMENPEKHERLIEEIKLEAALITNNSPYAEVRAVVDNSDDPNIPASTIRAWSIGILFSAIIAAVNQLFSIRQPHIRLDTNLAQLLAFPAGKAWEKWMPEYEFTIPFTSNKINLNPGRFSKKEHMLIAIMAATSRALPVTNYLIWTQALPQYFNQPYARSNSYIFLNAFATNFIGYGLAGLTRKFLVYPSYCVWPKSLVTIALNAALHNENNPEVMGPFKKIWKISRYRFFLYSVAGIFVYFWFPNYIFQALTYFSWMTWIAPDNIHLSVLTGMQNGLGMFNPITTFDWNAMCHNDYDPLMLPSFVSFNAASGMFLLGLLAIAVWYTNTWNTGYLPINSNRVFDHFGKLYNISAALDKHGIFDLEKYSKYSAPYMSATQTLTHAFFYAIYTAVITHVILYHRYELSMGFKNLIKGFRFKKNKSTTKGVGEQTVEGEYMDVHNRLMAVYPEGTASYATNRFFSYRTYLTKAFTVSEWWYFSILVISIVFGILGIALFPTYTSPAVVLYGLLLAAVFIIPVGLVFAMTGLEVPLNVLGEFIGGLMMEGNALAMNFFKSYIYITCTHAVHFANDLKLAHYVHIPPRVTFAGQMVATLVSTLVCTGVLKFQMEIKDVCTSHAPMRFWCPGNNIFFTASVIWGTIGPTKVVGKDGQYKWLLLGFPGGILAVVLVWALKKRWPNSRALRQIHVVAAIAGMLGWAPYNFAYMWPNVPIAWLSWIYIRNRYLGFWSKYNFVLSASFSAGIAIAGTLMLFSVQWAGIKINWWGNTSQGCEAKVCTLYTLAKGERFYPWWDGTKIPAP